ncbi:MAG: hypothetical protein LUG91_11010 [Ruminococcus sp.]|nr:hypothetical protein [Ruminococcus sp.]
MDDFSKDSSSVNGSSMDSLPIDKLATYHPITVIAKRANGKPFVKSFDAQVVKLDHSYIFVLTREKLASLNKKNFVFDGSRIECYGQHFLCTNVSGIGCPMRPFLVADPVDCPSANPADVSAAQPVA